MHRRRSSTFMACWRCTWYTPINRGLWTQQCEWSRGRRAQSTRSPVSTTVRKATPKCGSTAEEDEYSQQHANRASAFHSIKSKTVVQGLQECLAFLLCVLLMRSQPGMSDRPYCTGDVRHRAQCTDHTTWTSRTVLHKLQSLHRQRTSSVMHKSGG